MDVEATALVEGAHDVETVAGRSGLHELTVFASSLASLAPLTRLPELRSLKVLATSVRDWSALADLAAVEELQINFCDLTDLEPLLRMASLRRATLFGVPLTRAAYETTRAQLAAQPVARWGRPPLIDCDPPAEWELNRALADRGSSVVYSEMSIGPLVARPGTPHRPSARADLVNSYAPKLRNTLDGGTSPMGDDDLLVAAGYPDEPLPEEGPSLITAHFMRGDAQDARAWIDAARLAAEDRRDALRFVERFPSLTFIRELLPGLEREERQRSTPLPRSFKRWRSEVIATVATPYRRMKVKFDGFDFHVAERANDRWYEVGLLGFYSNSLRDVMTSWGHLYPIAYGADGYEQTTGLGIPFGEGDERVFEYSERALYEARESGASFIPIYPAFRSWWSLLGRICAVSVDGQEIRG
jgi:hypothetical protein